MQAGRLRRRLDFESPATTKDSFGEVAEAPWALETTLWGSIEPLIGRELLQAQQVQAAVTHRVRVRYDSTIGPDMRIAYGSRSFEILAVMNPEERNRELEIMCKELL